MTVTLIESGSRPQNEERMFVASNFCPFLASCNWSEFTLLGSRFNILAWPPQFYKPQSTLRTGLS